MVTSLRSLSTRAARNARRLAAAGLAIGLVCCAEAPSVLSSVEQLKAQSQPPKGDKLEVLFPTSTAKNEANKAQHWSELLPAATISLPAGSKVWATVPKLDSPLTEPSLYTIEQSQGKTAVLISRKRRRIEHVPAAVIHPVRPPIGLQVGGSALISTFTTPAILGRVVQYQANKPIRAQYDWAGETREIDVDHAETPRRGLVPMAFVAYPKVGRQSMGMLVALDNSHGWVWTSAGSIERHVRQRLRPLFFGSGIFKVNDKVEAYRWSQGFQRGFVAEVMEPKLRYRVHFRGGRAPETFFFDALVPR